MASQITRTEFNALAARVAKLEGVDVTELADLAALKALNIGPRLTAIEASIRTILATLSDHEERLKKLESGGTVVATMPAANASGSITIGH